MITITYFVHGTTVDNERGLATGWLPGELSQTGKEQAAHLGDQVADQRFDVVYCSDLQRATTSAELGFGAQYQIIVDSRLRECNYGDMHGKPTALFKNNMEDFIDTPFPKGESYRDVEKRLRDFVDFIHTKHAGQHIAIVAHQAPQLALEVILNGKTWHQAIAEDWRKTGSWQPGWHYRIKD